jgi:uncharacterized protein YfdQ (DUF2303 family)
MSNLSSLAAAGSNVPGAADSIQVAGVLNALATAASAAQEVAGAHFVIVPAGYTHKDITEQVAKVQDHPSRKSGEVQLRDVDSLLTYLEDQDAQDDAYIYANPDTRVITAVFNDNRAGTHAGWRDYRATYKAEYTTEFTEWLQYNKKPMQQTEFAEFIERNFVDITEPAAQVLLDVATTIQAKTNINFGSAKRLDNGQVQLQYTETIDASAGANGSISIPREFNLGLRLFKNGGGYKLKARLKYRLQGPAVVFTYELDRHERAVEDAFAGYVETIREKSGYKVLVGAAG